MNEQIQDFLDTKESAEAGDVMAYYQLGIMYKEGNGTPENDLDAIKWLELSVNNGNKNAILPLFEMLIKRKERLDEVESVLKRFALQNDVDFQMALSKFYVDVKWNQKSAYIWASIAYSKAFNIKEVKDQFIATKRMMRTDEIEDAQATAKTIYEGLPDTDDKELEFGEPTKLEPPKGRPSVVDPATKPLYQPKQK